MAKQSHTPSHFPALDRLIKKHEAAVESYLGPTFNAASDAEKDRLEDAEANARNAIAAQTFKTDAEFLAALKYLVAAEAKILQRIGGIGDEFDATIAAVAKHFGVAIVPYGC